MPVQKADVVGWLVNLCDLTIHHLREVAHASSFSPDCITRVILFTRNKTNTPALLLYHLVPIRITRSAKSGQAKGERERPMIVYSNLQSQRRKRGERSS